MTVKKWVAGDIDGFFGLFIDNLLQLMLIAVLCEQVCGLPAELITHRILPAAALSILGGNFFYSWQAYRLAKRTGRSDVTALPYGINTASLLAYIFLIMGPVYQETKDVRLVWQMGVFACLLSGVIETLGAFVGPWIRRHTPRAALLSSLAGVAITFIAMGFIFQIFATPAIAIVPMMVILMAYAGRRRLPGGIPGGFAAVVLGVALAWMLKFLGWDFFPSGGQSFQWGLHPPVPVDRDFWSFLFLGKGWTYMAVIFPMGLFNLIGSLQNLESAEAAGDTYSTRSSLFANGLFSLLAAGFGSAFPTTIYIGHPAWKSMGARIGYSVVNGMVIALLCLLGMITLVIQYVPLEVTLGILLWIGIIMTAQAYQEVPKAHALAVSLGLIPALAAWALILVETSLRVAGTNLAASVAKFGNQLYIDGVIALSQGFLLSSMVLASIMVYLLEQNFRRAALWTLGAAVLSQLGLIHAYEMGEVGVVNSFGLWQAPAFTLTYFVAALVMLNFGRLKPRPQPDVNTS